ncbi:Serine/threonine-protein kinase PknB [Phycisphaerae bacterium RAS1]|nr:Serine/threonine-protein kinase PknB [Phycisphaerae bacterium RAS1]
MSAPEPMDAKAARSPDDRIVDVLAELAARRLKGESVSDARILAEYAALSQQLAPHLEDLRWVEHARADARRPSRPGGTTLAASESMSVPVRVAPHPDSFPGYQIVGEIHRGGQGVVYQAVQLATKRSVAIKVMREGPLAGSRDRARFEREVHILGQLRHPNIVTIHDSGEADGNSFFVMDFIAGQPLDVYMASGERSIEQTLRLLAKICDAVAAAHLCGIIHRDLKPSNIRIDAAGEPHVLDFGLAKVASSDETAHASVRTVTGQFVGSMPWASPEQIVADPDQLDVRTDVYSLGVIAYQMLTGRFPYEVVGPLALVMENIREAEPVRPREIRRLIDDEVETIVLKCLRKEREHRYQGAAELARDVYRYLAGEPIEAKRQSAWYVLKKSLRRQRLKLIMAGAAAVAVLATAVFYSFRLAGERSARLAAQERAILESSNRVRDRERLTSVLARIATGERLDESHVRSAREFLPQFGERLRAGELDEAAVADLTRLLTVVQCRGRRITGVGIDPVLSLEVRTRPNFWIPGIGIVVSTEMTLDGRTVVDEDNRVMELYSQGESSYAAVWPVRGDDVCRVRGAHELGGQVRVRLCERGTDPSRTAVGRSIGKLLDGTLDTGRVYGECTLPIPAHMFTVTEGLREFPIEIRDDGLAQATADKIEFTSLRWVPASRAETEHWELWAVFQEQFAYLAFDLEMRDAREVLLGSASLVVDPGGRVAARPRGSQGYAAGGLGESAAASSAQREYAIRIARAAETECDERGVPTVVDPVSITLRASRRAALSVPEVDSYLSFSLTKSLLLRP